MPGAPLNLTIPSSADTWPTWASKVEDCLSDIEADLEPAVLFSELSANADLNLANYGVTGAKYYTCYVGNTAAIPVNGIGVRSGEWWVTDGAGNSIQLTSGGALNFAATGGFTGDYVSAGAQARYTNASQLYEFLNGAGGYADLAADDIRVQNSGNYVTLSYGGSVNTAWTFPTTAPAGAALLTIDAAGQVAHNATVAVGFTINNANITLSGTADIKHADQTATYAYAAHGSFLEAGGATTTLQGGDATRTGSITVELFPMGDMQRVGARLKSVRLDVNKSDATATTINLFKVDATGARSAAIATSNTVVVGETSTTATVGAPSALVAGEHWSIQIVYVGAGTNIFRNLRWAWDRT